MRNKAILALGLLPEIVAYTGLARRPIFMPAVGNYRQGMVVQVPLHLDDLPGKPTGQQLEQALRAHYGTGGFVSVEAPAADGKVDALSLNATNRMTLRVHANEQHRQAVLVACLDNLGKGASGAAVQNAALMLGLPVSL